MNASKTLALGFLAAALCGFSSCDPQDAGTESPELAAPGPARFGRDQAAPEPTPRGSPADQAARVAAPTVSANPELDTNAQAALARARRLPAQSSPLGRPQNMSPVPGTGNALIIGDSHSVGEFGVALYGGLVAHGLKVSMYAVCGASIGWWTSIAGGTHHCGHYIHPSGGAPDRVLESGVPAPRSQPEIRAQLAAKPALVVIALGANGDRDMVHEGATLLSLVPAESRCVWISPPPVPHAACPSYDRGDFAATFEKIKAGAKAAGAKGECELINSSEAIHPTRHADCHFYGACATSWGRYAAGRITGAAAPPSKCAEPKS